LCASKWGRRSSRQLQHSVSGRSATGLLALRLARRFALLAHPVLADGLATPLTECYSCLHLGSRWLDTEPIAVAVPWWYAFAMQNLWHVAQSKPRDL
jgi:hypothetical protein